MLQLEDQLRIIISDTSLHARWINTLSYMENCGARKISRCEHPILVKEEMLKHAAEEFRHSHYLKQQIKKISNDTYESYQLHQILGGRISWHYLDILDMNACRLLKEYFENRVEIRKMAYLIVTHAIEVRASMLYPLYEKILRDLDSPVRVKSIILEEEEHLSEISLELNKNRNGLMYSQQLVSLEQQLFTRWLHSIQNSIIEEKYQKLHKKN